MKFSIILVPIFALIYKVSDRPTTQLPVGYTQKLSNLRQATTLDYQLYHSTAEVEPDHYIHYDDVQLLDSLPTQDPKSITNGDVILISRLEKRQAKAPVIDCPTEEQCVSITRNCSSHGVCTRQPHPRKVQTSCFYCSCTLKRFTSDTGEILPKYPGFVKWTGSSCQSQDISTEFHIIFWTSLAIFFAMILAIKSLASIGQESGDIGVEGKAKME